MPSRDGLNTFIIGGYSPLRRVAIFFFVAKMSKVKLRERCGWLQVLIQKFLMRPVTLGVFVSFRKGIIMERIPFSRMAYAAQHNALRGEASEIAAFDAKVIAVPRRALLHQAAAAWWRRIVRHMRIVRPKRRRYQL